ncbi:MAG: 4Fe-4S binding protein [Spirochaetales bacterium]|nr:4Fe-4S binding protein [Spirochaetales bacterium]
MKITHQKAARYTRWAVLTMSTVFFLFFSSFISVHAVCPIGGFEMFFAGIFRTGFTIAGLFSGMVLTFLIMSVVSIIFRRAYCAYICPLGALQELSENIGKKVLPAKIRNAKMPRKLDAVLRWGKYVVLALFIILGGTIGGHWMIKGDPFIVMMGLFSGNPITEQFQRNPSSFLFLIGILVFAFFMGRGFCKYICPAGAWYGLLSKISPNKIRRDVDTCVGCNLCSKACPADIDVANLEVVNSAECFGCRECVNVCPKEGALAAPVAKVDVNQVAVPVAAAMIFAGSVGLAASVMPSKGGSYHGGKPDSAQVEDADAVSGADQADSGAPVSGGCAVCIACGLCGAV